MTPKYWQYYIDKRRSNTKFQKEVLLIAILMGWDEKDVLEQYAPCIKLRNKDSSPQKSK